MLNLSEDTTPQLGGTLDANGNVIDMGTNNITDAKVGQWDTAYSWGDHSTQNYLSGNIGFPKDLGAVSSSATTFPPGAGPNLGSIASGDTFIGVVQDLGSLSTSSSGISLTDLSVGSEGSASGDGGIAYNSSTGVFTYTPPDLSSYLTSVPAQTFSSLTGKPTTIAGYGITDAFDGAFGSLSGKPTTLAGYGITDGLQLGTSSTTALAGDTTIPSAVSELSNDSAFITNSITTDFTLTNTDTGSDAGPIINLKRDSSSPANADYLGQIKFKGENSSGAEKNYAKITGKILDVTDGAEDGMIEYAFIKGGSQNISARFRGDALQLLNGTNLYIGSTGLIQFEGSSADAYETNLTVAEPTADRTVTIPDESGTVSLDAGWKKLGSANWTSDTGYADFNVVDATKYRQYKVAWWISHQNSTNSGNQWFITSAVFLTSGGEVSAYDNNVTWRNSSSSSETVNSTYAGNQTRMWLAGNGTTYDSHGEALFTVPNGSSFRAAMRGNSQLIGAPRQGTTAVNYLEEMASVAYNQDPTAITGIRIRSWNGTGYTSQAGNITIFGMEM